MTSPASDTDPVADTAAVRDATARLLAAVATLDDAAVAEPSLLPGWTRGHLLAHVARNADALVNVLERRPMYASAEARDADIEAGADRPAAAQGEDLRASADRLDRVLASYTGEQWGETVELRNGVTDSASSIPFRRLVEVELHHVDLGAGHTLADLPGDFTDRAIGYLATRFTGKAEVPPLALRAEAGGGWTSGRLPAADEERQTVAGPPAALLGWLAGRTTGEGLTTAGTLPALPPL